MAANRLKTQISEDMARRTDRQAGRQTDPCSLKPPGGGPASGGGGQCLQDTCRVPCSATWPCSAACRPAGFQPAGRPRSGPGQSVSVREGSGHGLTTCLIGGMGGAPVSSPSSSPLPPLSPPVGHWSPAPDPPGFEPVAPLPGMNAFLIGSGTQRAWSIWRLRRTANAFWWRLVLCCGGVVPRRTPPGWRCVPHLQPKSLGTPHQVTCRERYR